MKDQEDRKRDKIKDMLKLNRRKSDKPSDHKVEFRFSSLQALKVPRGWDRLLLSIISEETGRLVVKSNKATVRSGTCQWTDTESIFILLDAEAKDLEESHFKIVVSTSSTRPAILGELSFNLTDYLGVGDSGPLLLPLKNCESGTTLQVRIQCMNPKSKIRMTGRSLKETSSNPDDLSINSDGMDSKSDGSDNIFNKTVGSTSSNRYADELGNRDKSLSGSHRSSDSGDGSVGRANFSPKNSSNGLAIAGRQDSTGSHASSGGGPEDSRSNPSSFNSRVSGSSARVNQWQEASANSSENDIAIKASESKELPDASEEIEELRDEVKMWERHSRQLKLDLGTLRKEIADKNKNQAELEMELSAAHIEHDSLRQEVEKLKLALKESLSKESCNNSKNEGTDHMQKELDDELKFQRESNANMKLQLSKLQESNLELVSILQELEETVEKQALEIANLSKENQVTEDGETLRSPTLSENHTEWERKLALKEEQIVKLEKKLSNMINTQQPSKSVLTHSDLIVEIEGLKLKVQELESDCAELTDENLDLIYKIKALDKDGELGCDFHALLSNKIEIHTSAVEETRIAALEAQITELEEELKRMENEEGPSVMLKKLERKCQELEVQLQIRNDEASDLQMQLQKVQEELEEKKSELFRVQQNHSTVQEKNLDLSKILERRSLELESSKNDLESHISVLEQENVQLSERISGLEAQLRYLTDGKESNRLELDDSKSLILNLKDENERLRAELEMQKTELKQKLQEGQKRLSEALEESDVLRRSNTKLQSTIENLIEECSSLQKINSDLKSHKIDLHERLTHLELELEESQTKNIDLCKQIDFLDTKVTSLQKEIVSKEKTLLSQLESIFQEHQEHEEKISQLHKMLNKMESEKTVEVENLERELSLLNTQVSSTYDEREKMASDALREVSILRSDKAKMETSLNEADSKVKLCENDLQTLRYESKNKIQGLVDLLNASKQSEEMLMNDIEHMKRQLGGVKSSDDENRKLMKELEVKLKTSDYEKIQMLEEISELKIQIQKISHLQDETAVLKGALDEAKFERGRLEESLKLVSEECEELKLDRDSLMEKASSMKNALNNGEDDRRTKIALQEKLIRMESDLSAKEASYANEAELKNELSRTKRANSEYQRKIQCLEQEKDELLKKQQIMEKEAMLNKEADHAESNKRLDQIQVAHGLGTEDDRDSKINILEKQLAEALEANNMCKMQLEEIVKKQTDNVELEKIGNHNDVSPSSMEKMSSLESELKDMKERYLQMSLQYAEVEAEREELVMQLKSVKKEKRWFS